MPVFNIWSSKFFISNQIGWWDVEDIRQYISFLFFPQHRRNSKNGSFHGSNSGSRRGSIEQLIRTNAISDEVNEMFLSQAAAIDDKFCLDDSGKPIAPQPKGQAHHMFSRILNLRIFLCLVFLQGRSFLFRSKMQLHVYHNRKRHFAAL